MKRDIQYKYTLVIPTRNRQKYCVEAVQSALLTERDDLQIIVSDNSDDPELLPRLLREAGIFDKIEFLESANGMLPMRENWERTIPLLRGEWITYIGDDDGVLKQGYELLDRLIARTNFKAYTWRPMYYKWPCFPEADRNSLEYATFDLQLMITGGARFLKSHQEWETKDKWPMAGPSIYHGAIHISIVDQTIAQFGEYFLNYVVDYSSAITNCLLLPNFLHTLWPVTVMGACGNSNTAGLTNSGSGKKKIDHFRDENSGLQALFDSFQDSRLHAPWVIKGYDQILRRVGLPFYMTPRKFLTSCMWELVRVRDQETFDVEKARLLAFQAEHDLQDLPIKHTSFSETRPEYGYHASPARVVMNVETMGWKGIVDVVRNYGALYRNPASIDTFVNDLAEKLHAENAAYAPKPTPAGIPLDLKPLSMGPEIQAALAGGAGAAPAAP